MKLALVILTIIASICAGPVPETKDEQPNYLLVEREDGLYEIEDLTGDIEVTASENDVTYYFYCQKDRNGVEMKASEPSTDFDASKHTLIIIHGWQNSRNSDVNTDIIKAALSKNDINIIVVDWSPIASKTYVTAQASVLQIGQYVASFITALESKAGLKLDALTIAGHSLGAHVAGNAGAALNRQVEVIIGLDPAAPLFIGSNINNRLDVTDAKRIYVIHTNTLVLGWGDPMGSADYYPNGGTIQPGCGIDVSGACSHGRSYQYFAESITSNSFPSRSCDSYNDFTKGSCNSRTTSSMGGIQGDSGAGGSYFLATNSASPFGKGSV